MAAVGSLGSFQGTVTPNVNMVEVFRKKEIENNPNSILKFADHMSLKKIGISCEPGVMVKINDAEIPIINGIFELGYGQIEITQLIFPSAVYVDIYYIY